MNRPEKEEDQDKAHEAYLLIKELCLLNPSIDMNQFVSGCFSVIVDRYHGSGASYKEFQEEMGFAIEFSRNVWNDE